MGLGSLSWDGAIYLWSLLSFPHNPQLQAVWLSHFRVFFSLLTLHVVVPVRRISLYKQWHWNSVVIYLCIPSPVKLRHKQMLQWWEVDQTLWIHESLAVWISEVLATCILPLYLVLYDQLRNQSVDTGTRNTIHFIVLHCQDLAHPPAGQHQL